MDYPTTIFAIVWGLFSVLVLVMLVRSYRNKTKSRRQQCIACNGMGFEMSINLHPPQCTRCGGTGYI